MGVVYAQGKRGCGFRVPGGVYAECGLSPNGMPVEYFLADPPLSIAGLDIAAQGVQLIPRKHLLKDGSEIEVHHVYDWVGASNYPHVADFVEEVRRLGVSRRISERIPVELLGPLSRLVLIHPRAIVKNAAQLHAAMHDDEQWEYCQKLRFHRDDGHKRDPSIPCSRDHWSTAPASSHIEGEPGEVRFFREFGEVASYEVWPPDPSAPEPEYEAGIFMTTPLTRLAVVKASDGRHEEVYERLRKRNGGLDIDITDA